MSGGAANGAFLDGLNIDHLSSCRYRTCGEGGDQCCIFSLQSEEEYNKAKSDAVSILTQEMHALDQGYLVIGNADFSAAIGNTVLDLYWDKVDGFCMEHVMAFEGVDINAEEPPFIRIPELENLIELRNRIVTMDLYLLVRSYPGPVGLPLDTIGTIEGPHLPPHHPYTQPTNNMEMQQCMKVGLVTDFLLFRDFIIKGSS